VVVQCRQGRGARFGAGLGRARDQPGDST
jgi:hypothetical protein